MIEAKEEKYLKLAQQLAQEAMKKFYKEGVWYLSDKAFKAKAPLEDNSYKSAMATMIKNLFELGEGEKARGMLESFGGSLKNYPHAYPEAIKSVLFYM